MSQEPLPAVDGALFLERLEALWERSLVDLQAFAQRERCSFDEVRRRTAEWHCKHLFEADLSLQESLPSNQERVGNALRHISGALESLQKIMNLQSFFLVVNPNDPADEGFLGGTLIGREFWRGHRGCGTAGAQAFKLHCKNAITGFGPINDAATIPPLPSRTLGTQSVLVPPRKGPASSIKAEVYANVRAALRAASGIRTAEMKWSNHTKLDTYKVRLVGWPSGVPTSNPSSLSVAQNQALLDALSSGAMQFIPIRQNESRPQNVQPSSVPTPRPLPHQPSEIDSPQHQVVEEDVFHDTVDFSWAEEEEPSTSPPHMTQSPNSLQSNLLPVDELISTPVDDLSLDRTPEVPSEEPVLFVDPSVLQVGPHVHHARKRRRESSGASQESQSQS